MLYLFRKYQKAIFAVTVTVVIASFTFFGAYEAFGRRSGESGSDTSKIPFMTLKDGTIVSQKEADLIKSFLFNEGVPTPSQKLGEGICQDYLLKNDLLAFVCIDEKGAIAKRLAEKRVGEKAFIPYKHTHSASLALETLWQRFDPSFYKKYQNYRTYLRSADESTLQSASAVQKELIQRTQLYLDQKELNADWMRQLLYYQEQQVFPNQPSEVLQRNLDPFGYRTLKDWIGSEAIDSAIKGIIELGIYSQEVGYKLAEKELKELLIYFFEKKNMTKETHSNPYQKEVAQWGADEKIFLSAWKRIFLSKAVLGDIFGSVQFNPAMYQNYLDFTRQEVDCDLYQLPKSLHLHTLSALQELEAYLSATSGRNNSLSPKALLAMPEQYYSVDQIIQEAPELVKRRYKVKAAYVSAEELRTLFTSREALNWMIDPVNFQVFSAMAQDLLSDNKSKELFSASQASNAEAFAKELLLFYSQNTEDYAKLENGVFDQLIVTENQRILTALKAKEQQEYLFEITFAGECLVVGSNKKNDTFSWQERLGDANLLANLLDKVTLSEAVEEEEILVQEMLTQFTPNNRDYFSFELIQRYPIPEVMNFEQARKNGATSKILRRQLQKIYDETPDQYRNANGFAKPLDMVKEQLTQKQLAPLLRAAEQAAQCEIPLAKLPAYRTKILTNTYYQLFQEKGPISDLVVNSEVKMPSSEEAGSITTDLGEQWRLNKTQFQLKRNQKHPLADWSQLDNAPLNGWVYLEKEDIVPAFAMIKNKKQKNRAQKNDLEAENIRLHHQYFVGAELQKNILRNAIKNEIPPQ